MATHDYVIDNSTGANVRADINNVLQAILTNNSNSSAPSTTAAYMWWADTNAGVLKIRNSANNDWVELLQLDGTLTLEDGTNSAPALAFRDDLDTGIYSSAANTFNIATGGTERMELGTTTIFNEDGADVDFRIEGDDEQNLFYVDAGNDRVGIATSTPSNALDVQGGTSNTAIVARSTDAKAQISLVDNSTTGVGSVAVGAEGDDLFFTSGSGGGEAMRIDSLGRLLIGHSTARTNIAGINDPQIQLEGVSSDDSSFSLIRNTNNAFGGSIVLGKTRGGTVNSNTAVQNGDDIGNIRFAAADGTDIVCEVANIKAEIDGVPGSNDTPGRLSFLTTADGASNAEERMRILSSGRFLFGRTTEFTMNSDAVDYQFEQLTSDAYTLGIHANNTNQRGIGIFYTTGKTADPFFLARIGNTIKVIIRGDGDLENANNSYGSISDVSMKENIVDANSQWDDIKNIKVRNYNFKESTGQQTHTQIGVIAQELETVSPKLVRVSEDGMKTVSYSILYMKAVKALQEAIARIEVLETKVAALEAG